MKLKAINRLQQKAKGILLNSITRRHRDQDQSNHCEPKDSSEGPAKSELRPNCGPPVDVAQGSIDDYWRIMPADKKWGTLTLAGSKLAEKRASRTANQAAHLNTKGAGFEISDCDAGNSRTLPRSFRPSLSQDHYYLPSSSLPSHYAKYDDSIQVQRQEQHLQTFNSWLDSQLAARSAQLASAGATRVNDANLAPATTNELANGSRHTIGQQPLLSHQATRTGPSDLEPQQNKLDHYQSRAQWPFNWNQLQLDRASTFTCKPIWMDQTDASTVAAAGIELARQQTLVAALANDPSSQPLGHRNSLARTTLPLVAPAAQMLDWPTVRVCPFYPPIGLGDDSSQVGGPEVDPVQRMMSSGNVCLGSNKRKRRLPHIEAKFTIEPPILSCQADVSKPPSSRANPLFVLMDSSMSPVSLPQPGQRSERRRLEAEVERSLSRVEPIDPREKIETYLRHFDQQQQQQQNRQRFDDTLDAADSLVELDHDDELTFQPYYNLPTLKYTLKLPIRRTEDGTLLLKETSHLRRSRRNSTRPDRIRSQVRRLGSSSSCPAEPLDRNGSQKRTNSSRHSLESALSQPRIESTRLANLPCPIDSLEDRTFRSALVNQNSNLNALYSPRDEPFYLRTPDCRQLLDHFYLPISRALTEVPPPPIPPRRRAARESEKPEQLEISPEPESSSSSLSPPTTNASSESHSRTLRAEQGRDQSIGLTSRAQTGELQSADENYEFDLVSSPGSSLLAARQSSISPKDTRLEVRRRRSSFVNGAIYTQVTKRQVEERLSDTPRVLRSQYYDYESMVKQQPIGKSDQDRADK